MIEKIEVAGLHMQVTDELKKYIDKKIGNLERFIPREVRNSVRVEIKLKESNARGKQERTCEVILQLPRDKITVKESTINIYAAIDIVEEKLKIQLKKYKETHRDGRFQQKILARLKRRPV